MTVEAAPGEAPPGNASPAAPSLRRNAVALGGDLATFHLGLAFASPQTLLPAFAERLGAANVVVGAIPALMSVGWLLPSIFAANYTQGLERRLPFLIRWTMFERVPYLVLGLAALTFAASAPGATLALLLAMLLLMTATGGLLMPAWLDLIGRVIPVTARGRFFALSSSLGSLLGLGGSAAVAWLLDRHGYPVGYGYCFLIGFGWIMVSFVFLCLVREPPGGASSARVPTGDYVRRLPGLIRGNPNLARFLGGRALSVSGGAVTGFFTVFALKQLGAGDVEVGVFTSLLLLAQTLGTLAFGWLADRRGHLVVLTLGAAATGVGALVPLAASSVPLLYPAFLLAGLGQAAIQVSAMAIGMEFGPESERPTYVAINNSSAAPFSLLAPILGGLLADAAGFGALFVLSAALSLAGAATFLLVVRDPRAMPAAPRG